MKKALFLCLIAAGSMSIFATPVHATPDISAKIMKSFHAHFPELTNAFIYHSGDTYTVSFRNFKNNTSGRIYYGSDGNVLETIRYYGAKELSPFIRSKIQSKYKDKSIFMVTDVENDSEHFYQVILENENSLMVIHVNDDGSMHLEKKYKKAA